MESRGEGEEEATQRREGEEAASQRRAGEEGSGRIGCSGMRGIGG